MPFAEIAAGRVHYQLDGPAVAPVLVLSNSLGATLSMWTPQVAPLSRNFRVLRYDTRGYGLSAAPQGPYTIENLGGDVVELLDALKIERAHFCGISMGGVIGLLLGIHAAGRLDRLVVCNSAARVGTLDAWNSRMAAVRSGGMKVVAPGLMERWFTADFRAKNAAIVESIQQMVLQAPVDGYLACCAAVRDADLRDEVAQVKVPTLVISGASDAVTPPADGKVLAEQIPEAQYLELQAAHLSNVEAAEKFNEALLQFLSQSR
jgi:3-oxoadipate enol-lactonase